MRFASFHLWWRWISEPIGGVVKDCDSPLSEVEPAQPLSLSECASKAFSYECSKNDCKNLHKSKVTRTEN